MDKLDYKKEYKELYQPKTIPSVIDVPEMRFFTVTGSGNPNSSASYKEALEILYGLSFTIKMSKMNGSQPPGYFDYVVPPLEGLWYVADIAFDGTNVIDKNQFQWISMIRQPEFVTEEVLEQAKNVLAKKKSYLDCNKAKLVIMTEGLCVQILHRGAYDNEPESIAKMQTWIAENDYMEDFSGDRFHHEIYLSDPRRCASERLRTVIRHPIKKVLRDDHLC